jgi:hypothetical protein
MVIREKPGASDCSIPLEDSDRFSSAAPSTLL